MAQVIIALGSNLGNRIDHLSRAKHFLSTLANGQVRYSSVFETEPVGEASTHTYLNAVCSFDTSLDALSLLEELKSYEHEHGRDLNAPRWANRTIDLDIIDYNRAIINRQRLQVPHPDYHKRLFVLVPLKELLPGWTELATGEPIDALITRADEIQILKTVAKW